MRHGMQSILILVCVLAVCLGCGRREEDYKPEPADEGPSAEQGEQTPKGGQAATPTTPPEEPPVPLTIPEVAMTDKLAATCLVEVGVLMPEALLPDTEGNERPLRELYGEKLTVVFFWTSGSSEFSALAAASALEDLQADVVEPFSEKGVAVVGVNEHDTAEVVGKRIAEAEATFPNLLDTDGSFFAKVATEKLPRIYILNGKAKPDEEGKILWFDVEFSGITRDKMLLAIRAALGEKSTGK